MADTIYALSSGIGKSGVAIVRVSGPAAAEAASQLTCAKLSPRKASLADITNPSTGELIDRGILLWFPGPASFTGEDVLEFHVHGGRAIVAALLEALSSLSSLRAAEPGEFTRRAFHNGKLDLTSAEGLADLIAADTELQRRQAVRQFSGRAGQAGRYWRQVLIETQALIEAHLDFPDESEIPNDVRSDVSRDLAALIDSFDEALASRRQAEILRDGAVVLLAGPPNSGKSTLLNRIAARDVAIISELPGTTRDLIEITVDLRGIPVVFIDSAGLRETSDPIEQQGIARTRRRARDSHVVVWLSPSDQPSVAPDLVHPCVRIVRTKSDLGSREGTGPAISALTGNGMKEFLNLVYEELSPKIGAGEPSVLATRRQFECVSAAKTATTSALSGLDHGSLELVAEDLRIAARALEELAGVITTDDLLDDVFGRFCLGK